METVEEIKVLLQNLKVEHIRSLNSGVIIHIERAEHHFVMGKQKKDKQYFTDSIYRCNQAYEGILREAYFILTGNDISTLSTYKIEEYFQNNNILNPRVLTIFTNYRRDWRNPSTHNHKLFFDEEETYLAIVSVESFIYILVKQILQSEIYKNTKYNLISLQENFKSLKPYDDPSIEKILDSLLKFNKYINDERFALGSEGLLVVAVKSYLDFLFPMVDSMTYLEKEIGYSLYSDITIKIGDNIICEIDIKSSFDILFNGMGNDRLKDYLSEKKGMVGIQYYYSKTKDEEYTISQRNDVYNNTIYVIFPKLKKSENKTV